MSSTNLETILNNRPSYVNNAISQRFKEASSHRVLNEYGYTLSTKRGEGLEPWSFNGSKKYKICALDDHKLFAQIIKDNPQQQIFNVLDVGAGDFTWAATMADFLSKSKKFQMMLKLIFLV